MNKINSFFGYFLYRLINRWRSSSSLVTPETYAIIIFDTLFVLPTITILILANNSGLIHYSVGEIEMFSVSIYLLFMIYTMYLESWIKKNSKQFIKHKWNKYSVTYIYIAIIINIVILFTFF